LTIYYSNDNFMVRRDMQKLRRTLLAPGQFTG